MFAMRLRGCTEVAQDQRGAGMGSPHRVLAHLAGDGVANQAVGEAEVLPRREQVGRHEGVGSTGRVTERQAGELCGDRKLGAVAEHGDGRRECGRVRRQACQAAQDRRRDTTRTRQRLAE